MIIIPLKNWPWPDFYLEQKDKKFKYLVGGMWDIDYFQEYHVECRVVQHVLWLDTLWLVIKGYQIKQLVSAGKSYFITI